MPIVNILLLLSVATFRLSCACVPMKPRDFDDVMPLLRSPPPNRQSTADSTQKTGVNGDTTSGNTGADMETISVSSRSTTAFGNVGTMETTSVSSGFTTTSGNGGSMETTSVSSGSTTPSVSSTSTSTASTMSTTTTQDPCDMCMISTVFPISDDSTSCGLIPDPTLPSIMITALPNGMNCELVVSGCFNYQMTTDIGNCDFGPLSPNVICQNGVFSSPIFGEAITRIRCNGV